jgi:hypothetical protein
MILKRIWNPDLGTDRRIETCRRLRVGNMEQIVHRTRPIVQTFDARNMEQTVHRTRPIVQIFDARQYGTDSSQNTANSTDI